MTLLLRLSWLLLVLLSWFLLVLLWGRWLLLALLLRRWCLYNWFAVVSLLVLIGLVMSCSCGQFVLFCFLHDCLKVHLVTLFLVRVVVCKLVIKVFRLVIGVLNNLWLGRSYFLLRGWSLFFAFLALLSIEIKIVKIFTLFVVIIQVATFFIRVCSFSSSL